MPLFHTPNPRPSLTFQNSARRPAPQSGAREEGRTTHSTVGGSARGAQSTGRANPRMNDPIFAPPHRAAIQLPKLRGVSQSIRCGAVTRALERSDDGLKASELDKAPLNDEEAEYLQDLVFKLRFLPSVESASLDASTSQQEAGLMRSTAHLFFESMWDQDNWDSLLPTTKMRDKLARMAKSFLVRTDFRYSPHGSFLAAFEQSWSRCARRLAIALLADRMEAPIVTCPENDVKKLLNPTTDYVEACKQAHPDMLPHQLLSPSGRFQRIRDSQGIVTIGPCDDARIYTAPPAPTDPPGSGSTLQQDPPPTARNGGGSPTFPLSSNDASIGVAARPASRHTPPTPCQSGGISAPCR